MRAWNIFYGIITFLIVTLIMIPGVLGMQSFTQWGGMYTDGWCSTYIHAYKGDEHYSGSVQCPTTKVMWSAPMHNFDTCMAWAQSWCGKEYQDGWLVYSSQPFFRGEYPYGTRDICEKPLPIDTWFTQNFLL